MRLLPSPLIGRPRFSRTVGLLFALVVVGCDQPVAAVPPTAPTVAFARTVDTHSRANLVWQDLVDIGSPGAPNVVAAGIRGDGRNRVGDPAASGSEYQGSYCGVRATIYDQKGENGNLNPDVDTDYTSGCGGIRTMVLDIGANGAPVVSGPMFLIDAIWTLGPGAVVLQPMDFGLQDGQSNCRFSFNASYGNGASNVRLSRLPDVQVSPTVTARQWRLQSQGTHMAACLTVTRAGKYVDTGGRYSLPFDVTITQVPYPYDTYPPSGT